MQVDRHVEALRGGEDRTHRGIVEVDTMGLAKDHRADAAQFIDCASQLVGSQSWI